jgi:hypothetical protein
MLDDDDSADSEEDEEARAAKRAKKKKKAPKPSPYGPRWAEQEVRAYAFAWRVRLGMRLRVCVPLVLK